MTEIRRSTPNDDKHDDLPRYSTESETFSLPDYPSTPEPSHPHDSRAPSRPTTPSDASTLSSRASQPPSYNDIPLNTLQPAQTARAAAAPPAKNAAPKRRAAPAANLLDTMTYEERKQAERAAKQAAKIDAMTEEEYARYCLRRKVLNLFWTFVGMAIAGIILWRTIIGDDWRKECIANPLRNAVCQEQYPELAACARDPLQSQWCSEKYPGLADKARNGTLRTNGTAPTNASASTSASVSATGLPGTQFLALNYTA